MGKGSPPVLPFIAQLDALLLVLVQADKVGVHVGEVRLQLKLLLLQQRGQLKLLLWRRESQGLRQGQRLLPLLRLSDRKVNTGRVGHGVP